MRVLIPSLLCMPAALSLFLFMGCAGDGLGDPRDNSIRSPFSRVTVNPAGLAIPAGGSGYATVTLTRSQGFNDVIVLSVSPLPQGVVASGNVPAGASSGRISIQVAPDVPPQSLNGLQLRAQNRSAVCSVAFGLTISAALPAGNLSPNLVNASGGTQRAGVRENTSIALEPIVPTVSTDASGNTETRHAFFPK